MSWLAKCSIFLARPHTLCCSPTELVLSGSSSGRRFLETVCRRGEAGRTTKPAIGRGRYRKASSRYWAFSEESRVLAVQRRGGRRSAAPWYGAAVLATYDLFLQFLQQKRCLTRGLGRLRIVGRRFVINTSTCRWLEEVRALPESFSVHHECHTSSLDSAKCTIHTI